MSAHCTVDHLLMFATASDTEMCSTGSKLISGALALTVPLGYILLHEQKWRVDMYTTVDSHGESTICPNIFRCHTDIDTLVVFFKKKKGKTEPTTLGC